jgi:hypothetical protein
MDNVKTVNLVVSQLFENHDVNNGLPLLESIAVSEGIVDEVNVRLY